MVPMPDILFEEKYKDTWEFEDGGWKPVAKPDAQQEVKDAIAEFVSAIEAEDDCEDCVIHY